MTVDVDLVWLQFDLRLADNPAMKEVEGKPSIFLFSSDGVAIENMGEASRVYLHHALASFSENLAKNYNIPLLFEAKDLFEALKKLSKSFRIRRVLWNRSYEPQKIARDKAVETRLLKEGIGSHIFPGSVLFEPWDIKNKSGQPFRVFTPYYKTVIAKPIPAPLAAVQQLVCPLPADAVLDPLSSLKLLPETGRWDQKIMEHWNTSESATESQFQLFLQSGLESYSTHREIPALAGTSRLSPMLHLGLISPRQIWSAASACSTKIREAYLRQIIWREFAISCLYHQPDMDTQPILKQFVEFPWDDDPALLRAWQSGLTGYPIVDAGMRELWQTGWMHNRVRMIVGSFLVKNLQLNWTAGAQWFWNTLVDADLANNSMGWQWVAGCGIDPSPFFRIFNPMVQGMKFDPEGEYVKRWVPELKNLPTAWIQIPWEAPQAVLKNAGITLGKNYPRPIVDFKESRQLALMAYDRIKKITRA